MNTHDVLKSIVAALAGGAVGWSAAALQLGGRVDAVERSVGRIEAQIDRLIDLKISGGTGATAKP